AGRRECRGWRVLMAQSAGRSRRAGAVSPAERRFLPRPGGRDRLREARAAVLPGVRRSTAAHGATACLGAVRWALFPTALLPARQPGERRKRSRGCVAVDGDGQLFSPPLRAGGPDRAW